MSKDIEDMKLEIDAYYDDAKEEVDIAVRIFKARQEAKLRARMRKFVRPYFRKWHPDRIGEDRLAELRGRVEGGGEGGGEGGVREETVRDSITSVLNFLTLQQDRFIEKDG